MMMMMMVVVVVMILDDDDDDTHKTIWCSSMYLICAIYRLLSDFDDCCSDTSVDGGDDDGRCISSHVSLKQSSTSLNDL